MRNAKPILGYPTKTAAILALHAEGKDIGTIVAACETTVPTVRATIRQHAAEARHAKNWPLAKREKALRIHAACLAEIGRALDVEVLELKAVLGVREPGPVTHARAPRRVPRAKLGAAPVETPPRAPEPIPSRADDEAELEALETNDDRRPAAPAPGSKRGELTRIKSGRMRSAADLRAIPDWPRYRLFDADVDLYLHQDGVHKCHDARYAWASDRQHLEALLAKYPEHRVLQVELV